jgi:methionyl-tRNA formyltransferase
MKIVYMGTPEFARRPLSVLGDSSHQVITVVTGPDKRSGRGRNLLPTACKTEAERRKIPVLTPASLKSSVLRDQLKSLEADLFVVVAFRILPESLFSLPRLGTINIHASLLPRYRGAAPINWAIINGEAETGLSSFFLKPAVDSGDIILQERTAIEDGETFDSLYDRLSHLAGPFLLKTLTLIESGDYSLKRQDNSQATPAPKLGMEDALIDFGLPADRVIDFVRGLSTRPGAYTLFRGQRLKIHACRIAESDSRPDTQPGTLLTGKKKLIVQCHDSAVELLRVVPAGKKEMDGAAFCNGLHPEPGEKFGKTPSGVKERK